MLNCRINTLCTPGNLAARMLSVLIYPRGEGRKKGGDVTSSTWWVNMRPVRRWAGRLVSPQAASFTTQRNRTARVRSTRAGKHGNRQVVPLFTDSGELPSALYHLGLPRESTADWMPHTTDGSGLTVLGAASPRRRSQRVGFFGGLFPWFGGGHLLPVST